VGVCRGLQCAPFFGELGIHPLAKPGLVRPPAEAFRDQQLINPAPLDGNTFVFMQIRRQPIQRPRGERQPQLLGRRQRGCDDFSDLWRWVGRWTPGARFVRKRGEPSRVETLEPGAHGDGGKVELVRNSRYSVPLMSQEKDASPFDQSGCRRT